MSPTAAAPDDIVETLEEGARNHREPLLVLEPLREFLTATGLAAPADLSAEPIGDGHSNVTFALSTHVVLRRPPRGPLPPSAHDVLREARLLSALEATPVRTPRVLAVCDDTSVITDRLPPALDNEAERDRMADRLIDALVELHSVDWQAAGLAGFGKPTGYLERQVRRFSGLWQHNRTRDLPAVEQLGHWLSQNMPQSPPATVVHGDYRLGNTMFFSGAPAQLAAILDWEMATIGDPLADLGYMMSHWHQEGDQLGGFNLQAVTTLPGFPSRQEMIARYEQRSGRSMRALDWYVTLALWKGVVFMEGNYKRAVEGRTDDPYLKSFGDAVVQLAERALDVTRSGF
jgi:aminoglycoside phosphotransferase (APT) family kinase protein